MKQPTFTILVAAVLCVLVGLSHSTLALTTHSGVYTKLLPGKEFCINYDAHRDPQEDPVTVVLQHRCLDARLAGIRLTLYSPGKNPGERGAVVPLDDNLDTFGDIASIIFKAEETGTYTMCFILPKLKPPMRFEFKFVASNDLVEPPVLEDGAIVVDKPTEVLDYEDRLRMLNISIMTTMEELRLYQVSRFSFDDTASAVFNICIGSVVVNIALALIIGFFSDKYLKRYYQKQKIA